MRRFRRGVGRGALVVVFILLVMAWSVPALAAGTYGGRLRMAYGLEASSLDPHLGRSGGDGYYWKQMYDNLVGADALLVAQPYLSLAESWEIPDPKTIVFKLRKGVVFHDGTEFNAEAVKFNIERVLDPAVGATPRASFTVIDKVEVAGPLLVKFHLKEPWGAGMSMLADRGGTMNSPTAVKKLGKEYGFQVSGTGPFKLAEYVSGSQCRMVKNDKYWGKSKAGDKLPYLDEVTLKIIPDEAVLSAALSAGEIDLAFAPSKDVDKFSADPKFTVKVFQGASIGHLLAFNSKKSPMDNVNLRRAVAYAVNAEAINKSVFFGKGIVAKSGMWPVGCWVYDDTVPRPTYNLEKAKEFLAKGGQPKGFSMDVITWQSSTMVPATEMLKAQLAQIGINLNVQTYVVGPATEKFFSGKEAPLFSSSWSRYPEPDWIASLCYKSKAYYNPGNDNPELDKLIAEGAATYDLAKRKAIYRKVNEIVLSEVYFLPTIYGVYYATAAKPVQGLDTLFSWDAKMVMHELWLKK